MVEITKDDWEKVFDDNNEDEEWMTLKRASDMLAYDEEYEEPSGEPEDDRAPWGGCSRKHAL